MAKFLHIETATKVCSVALSEDGCLVDSIEASDDRYIHSEKLTLFIESICQRNKWTLKELNAVVVTSGPGSYTGLRIGVSTAKGLCYALSIPLLSIDAVETIARLASIKHPNKNICAMIDARRMEVFSAIYSPDLHVLKPLSADELTAEIYADFYPFVVVGDGAQKLATFGNNEQVEIDSSCLSSAKGQVEVAFQKFLKKEFEDVAYFEPKYLKDFIALKSQKKIL